MPTPLERSVTKSRQSGAKITKGLQDAFSSHPGGHQARTGGAVAQQIQPYKRDYQTGRVYLAEKIVRRLLAQQYTQPLVIIGGSTITIPLQRVFGDLPSVQTYCTDALNRLWPDYPGAIRQGVKVRSRKGVNWAHYENHGTIALPVHDPDRWAMREFPVLHELAHHLVDGMPGGDHGTQWVRAFLQLLDQQMGPEAALLTRIMFGENGVNL